MSSARNTLRRLLAATLLFALATLFLPAQAKGVAMTKMRCCVHVEVRTGAGADCPAHHKTPAKEEEVPCCQACALGLALLFVAPPDFVYAQTGETSLVSISVRSHSLPHRPPVPPPRAAFA